MADTIDLAKQGDVEQLRNMVNADTVDITVDFAGRTILYYAAETGQTAAVKFLLEEGANVNHVDMNYQSPLICAVFGGHKDVVELLIKNEADVNQADENGRTCVSYAAEEGRADIVKDFIDSWAQVDLEDSDSRTPLTYAAEKGHTDVVEMLVKAGVNVNHVDSYSRTALAYACKNGHFDVAKLLLSNGAQTNVYDNDGQTMFSYALKSGKLEIVKLLFEQGASVNASENFDHRTPLFLAVEEQNLELIYVLLAYGADVNHKDKEGRTPLFSAVATNPEIVSLLLMRGSDVNATAIDKSTPLMHACRHGNPVIVKALLEIGADVQLTDDQGRLAVDYAASDDLKIMVEEKYLAAVVYQQRYEPLRGMETIVGDCSTIEFARDVETGDTVVFKLMRDEALWKHTASILKTVTPDRRLCVARLITAAVTAGRAQQADPFRLSVFIDAQRFPATPYVLVIEAGDTTLQELIADVAWQQPSRLEFVAASLARSLDVLHSHGLVHCDLSTRTAMRFFDGSIRLVGAEAIRRHGDYVQPKSSFEVVPPEAAKKLLEGQDVRVEVSWHVWSYGAVMYEVATGNKLIVDLNDGEVPDRDEALHLLSSLTAEGSGQAKIDELLTSFDKRARVPKKRLAGDFIRRKLLRVEPWQRASAEKLMEHPFLSGDISRGLLRSSTWRNETRAARGGGIINKLQEFVENLYNEGWFGIPQHTTGF